MMMITVHPPPPAPDEGTAKRRLGSCEEGDVDGMVVLRATGQRVTPLAKAFASNPIHTVAMATKFPPEFLQVVEEQTVMSGTGEELDSAPTVNRHQESSKDPVMTAPPQPGSFHELLNAEFRATPDLDAMAVRIWGFLEKGAQQADAVHQAFEKEIHNFRAEQEDIHEDMRLLHADRVDPRSIDGMVEESIALRLQTINSNMLGVVSTLASICHVQQSLAA